VNAFVLTVADIGARAPAAITPVPTTGELVAATYDRHQRELFSFALHASRDRQAAEDLVHEAFIRLIVEIEAGRTPRNVRAWLYRVVANLVISGGRRATVAQRQMEALARPETEAGPEPAYLDHERQSDLDAILGELGADALTALVMAANGFNGIEIAEAIGRSGGATRSLMCRARLHLRDRLGSLESFA
jgi:RNA polymerase sigma-70 factor (ECF subfamily)